MLFRSLTGDGYLSATSPSGFPSGNSPYTVSTWVLPRATGTYPVSWGAATAQQGTGIQVSAGKPKFFMWSCGDLYSPSTRPVDGSTWTHIVGVYDPDDIIGARKKLYVNGVCVAYDNNNDRDAAIPVGTTFNVGCGVKKDGKFNGAIDIFGLSMSRS